MNQYLMGIVLSLLFIIGLMVSSDMSDGVLEDSTYSIILWLGVGVLGILTYMMIRYATEQEKQIKDLKED